MYPEVIVSKEILAQLFPGEKNYEIPRSKITPLGNRSTQKVVTVTPSIEVNGKMTNVVISLIREKNKGNRRGFWRGGQVVTDYGLYKVIFKDDHPIVIPA